MQFFNNSRFRMFRVGAPLSAFLFVTHAFAMEGHPIIESIEGDKIVVVKTPEGNRVGTRGTAINFGDKIKTGPRASAKILYPDGSKLLIGRGTEMEVQGYSNGIQWNELKHGEVRGVVKPAQPGTAAANAIKAPPKFAIRSKTAVMGVRGTDFVFGVEEAAGKVNLHTLDGLVDVAKTDEALLRGEGVHVGKGQFTQGNAGQIAKVQAFNVEQYRTALNAAQPEFVALSKNDPEILMHSSGAIDPSLLAEPPADPWLKLLRFQVSSLYIKQKSGGEALTGEFAWTPHMRLLGPIGIAPRLAYFNIKDRTQSGGISVITPALQLTLKLSDSLSLEGGIGVEEWKKSNSGVKPQGVLIGALSYQLSVDKLLERIVLGVSSFDANKDRWQGSTKLSPNPSPHFRVGIGLRF